MGYIPARTDVEWRQLIVTCPEGLIRTMEDWKAYIRDIADDHPLVKCDSRTIEEFTESLVFRNGGLAGAKYGVLSNVLTYDQFSELWAKFGMDMDLFEDHKGYKCVGPGNCRATYSYICTSNC